MLPLLHLLHDLALLFALALGSGFGIAASIALWSDSAESAD